MPDVTPTEIRSVARRGKHKKTDWSSLKMLFATGTTHEEIHKATKIPMGTISSRSLRDNWAEARQRVKDLATNQAEQAQAIVVSHQQKGGVWPNRVAVQAEKVLSVLEDEEVTDVKSADKFVTVLDKADKVGRRSYGLENDDQNKTIVNLGILQSFEPEDVKPDILEAEVIA